MGTIAKNWTDSILLAGGRQASSEEDTMKFTKQEIQERIKNLKQRVREKKEEAQEQLKESDLYENAQKLFGE